MQKIQDTIKAIIRDLYNVDFTPDISPAPKKELGDYCVNIFPIVKSVWKAPNIISGEVADALARHTDIFASTSATGGYVNFFLTDSVWLEIFTALHEQTSKPANEQTIVVDYIGANVGKPLHIGHICTPSIGQVISNVYRHLGYRVIGDSHFGDWGGIFGKLIIAWKERIWLESWNDKEKGEWLFFTKLEQEWINFLLELYQWFFEKVQEPLIEDWTFKKTDFEEWAREEFKKLVDWDEENTKLWKKFTAISITETEKKLDLLGVHATYNIGESFYEGLRLPRPNGEDYPALQYTMKDIVRELIEKWIATQNDDGSVGVVFPDEMKMPSCILQKKDGTGLYLTSDLAAIRYRLTNGWNPSKIIYSVDVRQQLHLRQAFTIAKMAWWKELWAESVEFFHAFNGFIKLKEWAMSTRHGTVIFLEELIQQGNERTAAILAEKWRTGDKALSEKDIQAITVGAIKYSYLTQDREKDVTFDWDKALNFEGHSGPYIQYAYVRARKIVQSDEMTHTELSALDSTLSPHDKSLIQILSASEWVIDTVAKTHKPHHLALYAYDVAVEFNSFYVHTPKILEEKNTELKAFRLALVAKTAETLKKSFELLAIEMPSEM